MPFLLLAKLITTLLTHFHSFLLVSEAFHFFWIAWLHYSFPMLMFAVHCHRSPWQCIALLFFCVACVRFASPSYPNAALFFCDSWIRCASPSYPNAALFFCDSWIRCASPAQNVAFLFFGVAFHMTTKLLLCTLVRVSVC